MLVVPLFLPNLEARAKVYIYKKNILFYTNLIIIRKERRKTFVWFFLILVYLLTFRVTGGYQVTQSQLWTVDGNVLRLCVTPLWHMEDINVDSLFLDMSLCPYQLDGDSPTVLGWLNVALVYFWTLFYVFNCSFWPGGENCNFLTKNSRQLQLHSKILEGIFRIA